MSATDNRHHTTAITLAALAVAAGPASGFAQRPDDSFHRLTFSPFSRPLGDITPRRFDSGFFNALPQGKLDFSFGSGLSMSFSERRDDLALRMRGFQFTHHNLRSEGRPALSITGLDGGFSFGASRLQFSGIRAGDRDGGFDRQRVGLSGKTFSFNAERLSVDQDFRRGQEIEGLSPEERKLVDTERGWSRLGFSASLTPVQGLSFSTDRFRAERKDDASMRSGYRDLAQFQFAPGARLSFLNEGTSVSLESGYRESRSRQNVALAWGTSAFSFSGVHDASRSNVNGLAASSSVTSLQLSSSQGVPLRATMEFKDSQVGTSAERSRVYDVTVNPGKNLMLHGRLFQVERSQGESSSLSQVDWSAKLSRGITFSGFTGSFSSDQGRSERFSQGTLEGELTRGVGMRALYDTRSGEAFGERVTYDLALQSTSPIRIRSFGELSFHARQSETRREGEREAGLSEVSVTHRRPGLEVGIRGSSRLDPNGATFREQSVRFETALPKQRVSLGGSYAVRDVNGQEARSITARGRYELRPGSHVGVTYSLRPENERRELVPRSDLAVEYSATSGPLRYGIAYTSGYNYMEDTRLSTLSITAQGTLRDGAKFSGMLGVDVDSRRGSTLMTPRLGVSYERRLSADDSVNLQLAKSREGLTLRLEAKKKF